MSMSIGSVALLLRLGIQDASQELAMEIEGVEQGGLIVHHVGLRFCGTLKNAMPNPLELLS